MVQSKKGVDNGVTDRIPQEVHDSIFDAAWDITTVDGKIYGMPWMLDQEMFFYPIRGLSDASLYRYEGGV